MRCDKSCPQEPKRVGTGPLVFDRVGAPARIDPVQVNQSQLRIERLRLEVIELEFERDLAPRLPLQAIHTAKCKLVAQPRSIAFVRGVARRPMASRFLGLWVVENQSDSPVDLSFSSLRCRARAPCIGRFVSDSTCSRIIRVRPANSMLSGVVSDPWISLSISSNRR